MTLEQLLTAMRDALDDHAEPPLYGDEELTRYLNNAVTEAALRTRMLKDDSGPACSVALQAGVSRYDLAPEVLVVRAAHVPGRAKPLVRTTAARMDRLHPGWSHQAQLAGVPEYAVFDAQQKTLTVFPPPAEAATLALRVWRLPDDTEKMEFDSPDDEPVLVLPNPEQLKHWALYEAYMKKDGELFDPARAQAHKDEFEAVFGPRPSVHDLTLWSTQPFTGPRRNYID